MSILKTHSLSKFTLLTALITLGTASANAIAAVPQINSKVVAYSSDGTALEGFYAVDKAKSFLPRPGILIVHDWMGLGDFQKDKAQGLAGMGFAAFAVDVYGKGVRPKDAKEAGELATKYKDNRALLRKRMQAAYDVLVNTPGVDKKHIIVMGYCFGGTAALELARSGTPLAGVASFHGGLSTPHLEDARKIKGRVLIMHGADDPYVPANEVETFQKEMKQAKVRMEFISYPGAVHAFTNPAAGNDKSKGAAYQKEADQKSWMDFTRFINEVTSIPSPY